MEDGLGIEKSMADTIAALAHPIRLRLLALLLTGNSSCQALADRFEVSRPAISQHLKVLMASGLVERERTGRRTEYSVHSEQVARLHEFLRTLGTAAKPRNGHSVERHRSTRRQPSDPDDNVSQTLRVSYRKTPDGGLEISATYKL